MRCYYSLEMTVAAPTKTTTRVTLDCIGLGVRVEKSGGSVKRPLEDALAEFAHLVRPALVKEAQEARAKTPWTPAEEIHKDAGAADPAVVRGFIGKIGEAEEEPAGPLPEHGPLFVPHVQGFQTAEFHPAEGEPRILPLDGSVSVAEIVKPLS